MEFSCYLNNNRKIIKTLDDLSETILDHNVL